MKLASPLLKHLVYPGLSKTGYLHTAARTEPVVLTYHGVLPAGYKMIDPRLDGNLVTADSFRRQLRFLKSKYNPISPGDFRAWCADHHELPANSVLLTCDDGLRNSLYDMVPLLQEFETECLFFVTGASLSQRATMLWCEELFLMLLTASDNLSLELPEIGLRAEVNQKEKHHFWWQLVKKLSLFDLDRRKTLLDGIKMQLRLSERWDDQYREDPALSRRFLMFNLPELHQLAAAGMCIGAHTLSHPILSESSQDVAWSEISDSKRGLEQALKQEVWAFAYPFGDSSSVTSRELQMAEQAAFECAFINLGGSVGTQAPKFALPRVHITGEMNLAEFQAHISGFHRSLRKWFAPTRLNAAGAM